MNAVRIEKEFINKLHFFSNDVINDEMQKKNRNKKLVNAAILGNIDKVKCKIVFHAQEGDNYVETTVWAVTEKYICLKGGVFLSKASIIDVVL